MLPSAESCAGSRPDWVDPTDDSVFLPYTPPEVRETWKIGTKILAYDIRRCWCEAVVRKISSEREVLVHYQGWNKRWDHWLPLLSRRLRAKDEESRAASSHTNAATAGHSTQASRDERPSVRASVGGGSAAASPRGGDVSSSAADTAADSLAAQQGDHDAAETLHALQTEAAQKAEEARFKLELFATQGDPRAIAMLAELARGEELGHGQVV